MNIITLEEQAFYQLVDTVLAEMQSKFGNSVPEWITEQSAMEMMNIRSKTTMQRMRDHDLIRFTQPSKKIILYHRPSILEYLDAHANI